MDMEEEEQDLPYVIWYQCRFCSHLFYDKFDKIEKHLREQHGYGDENNEEEEQGGEDDKTPSVQIQRVNNNNKNIINSRGTSVINVNNSKRPSNAPTPVLKIKEHHIQRATSSPSPAFATNTKGNKGPGFAPSTSSGTDGEGDPCAEDVINNNMMKRMPKLIHKNDIVPSEPAITAVPVPRSNSKVNNIATNRITTTVPSLAELKKQLVNANIDIEEVKVNYGGEEHHQDDNEEDVGEEEMGYGGMEEGEEEYGMEGYGGEGMEEDYEDGEEEGASTSNQSFYDKDAGGHFLFEGGEEDDEDEYEDDEEGTMTPSFGMVDELVRRATLAASRSGMASTSGGSDHEGGMMRRRSFHNPCKLCNKVFPSLSMLKKHAKTHLNDEGGASHICKFCFDYFPSAAGLSKHLRVHTEENPNVCNTCGKSFTSWATLRTHMKIHSGERPFGCDQCGQRFQTKSTLDSHLRIHSGSRPHVCPICSKSFRTSSPLYRHMRSVHKGVTVSVGSVTVQS